MIKGDTKRVSGNLPDGRRFSASWEKIIGRSTIDKEKLDAFLDEHGYTIDDFSTRGQDSERLVPRFGQPSQTTEKETA